ncbi:MAG TPA: septum formation initiator family protein [Candidatus Paceibacterota bacterium]|jgi:cell division protein FtsB|nr:septum formation initiator family protein [Candidatus Paceibacterota bacterium]
MREFQERRRIKKLLHSRYAIAGLAIICLFLCRGVWNVYAKYEKSRDISVRMDSELASLQAREDSLKGQIDSLDTPEGREREIRDRFGVVKEGEKVVVLVNQASDTEQAAAVAQTGFWSWLTSLFR